jgi:hypothetical protein
MEEYYGGKLFTASEEDVMRMTHGFSLDEVCRFHREKGGVCCNQKRRTDYDCEHCGWNPRVSRYRLRRIKEERNWNE